MKLPTSYNQFEIETSLCLNLIAEIVLDEALAGKQVEYSKIFTGGLVPALPLTTNERNWFIEFVSTYIRWLDANDKSWRKQLRDKARREFVYGFVRHWCAGFLKNPDQFKTQHSIDLLIKPVPNQADKKQQLAGVSHE